MVRDWFDGLDESGRRITVLLVAICLASLPLYALGVWQLSARSAHTEELPAAAREEAPAATLLPTATPTSPAVSTGVQNLNASQPRPVQLAPAPPPPAHAAPPGHEQDKHDDHPGDGGKEHGHRGH